MSRRPRTFQNSQCLQRIISYEEFQKLDHSCISDTSAPPQNNPETTDTQGNPVSVLDIAPRPKEQKENLNNYKLASLSERKKRIQGYSYTKLTLDHLFPRLDDYELKENDILFLQKFNETRTFKAVTMKQESNNNGEYETTKKKSSNSIYKKSLSEDIFKNLIIHFELKSTRQTTAMREEILIEMPKNLFESIDQDELDSIYQYWKNERENDRHLRQGEISSQKEIFPFLRRHWRASFEEQTSHQVFRRLKDQNKKKTRKSTRQDQNEIIEKLESFEGDMEKCKMLVMQIQYRELLKREIAYHSIMEFNSSVPGLQEEFQILNTFTSREKDITTLQNLGSKNNLNGIVQKQSKLKTSKKAQLESSQISEQKDNTEQYDNSRGQITDSQKKQLNQLSFDGQVLPNKIDSVLLSRGNGAIKDGSNRQSQKKEFQSESDDRGIKDASEKGEKNKNKDIVNIKDQNESNLEGTLMKSNFSEGSKSLNQKKKAQRNINNKIVSNEDILQLEEEKQRASYLAAFLIHFSTLNLPITLENARLPELIDEASKSMQEQKELKLKNPNIMAYLLRKRIGRCGRVYLDRVCEEPIEASGIQSGKISYFIEPLSQKVVYNTFHYNNQEAIRYYEKLPSILQKSEENPSNNSNNNNNNTNNSNNNYNSNISNNNIKQIILKPNKKNFNQSNNQSSVIEEELSLNNNNINSNINNKFNNYDSHKDKSEYLGISVGEKIINQKYQSLQFLKDKRQKLKNIIEKPFIDEMLKSNPKQQKFFNKVSQSSIKMGKWTEISDDNYKDSESQDNKKLREIIEQGEYKKWKDGIMESEGNQFKKVIGNIKKLIGEKIRERENQKAAKLLKEKQQLEELQRFEEQKKINESKEAQLVSQLNDDNQFDLLNQSNFNQNQQPFQDLQPQYSEFPNFLSQPSYQQSTFLPQYSKQQSSYDSSNQFPPPSLHPLSSFEQQAMPFYQNQSQFRDSYANNFDLERNQQQGFSSNPYLNQNFIYPNAPQAPINEDLRLNYSPTLEHSPPYPNYEPYQEGLNDNIRNESRQRENDYYDNNLNQNNYVQEPNFINQTEEQQLDYFNREENPEQYLNDNLDNQPQNNMEDFE